MKTVKTVTISWMKIIFNTDLQLKYLYLFRDTIQMITFISEHLRVFHEYLVLIRHDKS